MKIKKSIYLLLVLFPFLVIQAQEGYPTPPKTDTHLFYIQHSENHNTYVYDANTIGGEISNENPVESYRIIYTEGGEKAPLNFAQQKFAYGMRHRRLAKNKFELFLPMSKEQVFYLGLDDQKKPVVYVKINNRKLQLERMFIKIKEGSGWNVKVDHVLFKGKDAETGRSITEKMSLKT